MTNWMLEDRTGAVEPLYVLKLYPTDTIESAGISPLPLRNKGQDDSCSKSESVNIKADFPTRALPSYTGTTTCQEYST